MQMPGYPPGVPNPLTRHVHPYPTRFHGTIYDRPVFGFPFAARGANQPQPGEIAGLGDVGEQYHVGNGIFRPGGYGGGLFDGNLAGLGAALGATAIEAPRGYQARLAQLRMLHGLGATGPDPAYLQSQIDAITSAINDAKAGGADAATISGLQGQLAAAKAALAKAKAPATTSVYVPPPAATVSPTMAAQSSMLSSSGNTKWIAFAVGGALALGVLIYMKKRKHGSMKANASAEKVTAAVWRVRLDSQGYDSRGRYFGVGLPLYEYVAQDSRGKYIATDEIRATDRNQAKDLIRRRIGSQYNVKFTR